MNNDFEKLEECLDIMFDLSFEPDTIDERFEKIRNMLWDFIADYKVYCKPIEKEKLEKWIQFSKNA